MSSTKVCLFNQVLSQIDRKHDTDKHSKGINSWTHLVSMLFMQLADARSLRDISNGLRSATGNLSHLGVKKAPCKSSLSYINKNRSSKVFEELYYALLEKLEPSLQVRRKYARMLKRKVFIMDASIIPLSLSLFDWAKFRTTKGAVKLHAVVDYDTGLPNYAVITDGKRHDVKEAKVHTFPSGSVVVADRAYVDYKWLYDLDSTGVYFVTRLKSNADIEVIESMLTNEKHEHILTDEQIKLCGFYASKNYPKARWDVEVFFKHIKQLFRVKTFVGTSANAVKIQMWCSMISILILKHLKNKAKFNWHLSNLVTFLRINLFTKIDLWQWIHNPLLVKTKSPPANTLFS